MNSGFLINGVLQGVLGVRPKHSHRATQFLTGHGGGLWSHPEVLMTAAGLAWGVYETLQGEQANPTTQAGGAAPPAGGPPPIPQTLSDVAPDAPSEDVLRLVRLAISAAGADGSISEQERAAVLRKATDAGAAAVVERELKSPRPLKDIVQGVSDPTTAATLYVLAFTILRADEQITGAERIYLAQLANLLHLDADTVQALEKDTGQRIDALGDQGQLGG
jgi:uncharacterized membrane protein YebE (DUF533 family)